MFFYHMFLLQGFSTGTTGVDPLRRNVYLLKPHNSLSEISLSSNEAFKQINTWSVMSEYQPAASRQSSCSEYECDWLMQHFVKIYVIPNRTESCLVERNAFVKSACWRSITTKTRVTLPEKLTLAMCEQNAHCVTASSNASIITVRKLTSLCNNDAVAGSPVATHLFALLEYA